MNQQLLVTTDQRLYEIMTDGQEASELETFPS